MEEPNHAMQRTADPRHASCVRTWRATGRGPLIAIVRRIERRRRRLSDFAGNANETDGLAGPSQGGSRLRVCASRPRAPLYKTTEIGFFRV
jgi:hypothetical protein